MKKNSFITTILALALAALMSLSALAADTARTERVPLRDTEPYVSETYKRFIDVPAKHWGKAGISYVVDKGLFNGTGPDTFSPETSTSRPMVATVLYRFAGKPAVSGDVGFADAKNGEWYSDAVVWAKQNRIFAQWVLDSPKLWPDSPITRGEFCVMLRRFYEYMGGNPFNDGMSGIALIFPDMEINSRSYVINPAIAWAYTYSVIEGTGPNTMSPNTPFTRSQLATMMERYDRQFGSGKPRPVAEETKPANPSATSAEDQIEDELIRLILDYRAENGLPRLTKNDKLMAAADVRAKEAAVKFSHQRPNGTGAETVLQDVNLANDGYFWENLNNGSWTAERIITSWKNSRGHNSTMLTPDPVTDIGVGHYVTGSGSRYTAMIFATIYTK